MLHLILLVLLVGAVDSVNPSTIAPALYLAAGKSADTSLLGFITGVLAVNLAGGLILTLGPGQLLLALIPHPGVELRHLLELCLGGATFLLAAGLWLGRARIARHVSHTPDRLDRSSLLVGAGIMAVELPTAVPYFAVIAAVVGSGLAIPDQVGLILIFNAAFIAPLAAILLARSLANERGRSMLERLRTGLDRRMATVIPALVLLISIVLTVLGTVGVITD